MKMSVIVPCYNSMPVLKTLVKETIRVIHSMDDFDEHEIILANDCSPNPDTIGFLKSIADECSNVIVVDMAVNSGQANTQCAALNFTSGDVIVSMDDDMQTHPENIPAMYEKLCEGYDVVMARYPKKKHVFYRRVLTKMDDWFEHIFLKRPKGLDFNSFWMTRRYIVNEIVKFKVPFTYMEGLFLRTAGKIANVDVQHYERTQGHSGYNLAKLVRLWSNFTGFSILPLRIIGAMGGVISLIAFIMTIKLLVQKAMGILVQGYASIMCVMLVFFGFTLISLGIMGEYIGRIFMSVNSTPQFVVKEIYDPGKRSGHEA